jgi:PPIC-type PPIASE domain
VDLAHLVHAGVLRAARSPAVHFVVLGVLLYAWLGRPPEVGGAATRLALPRSEIERLGAEFRQAAGRPPTAEEARELTERLVDREVLYQYALRMKLDQQPVVRRRLAQIAAFVAPDPNEPATMEERADQAVALGLQHGDLIVRRILIDSARRLIRAPWLVRDPDDATLQAYLEAHPEPFEIPAEVRITHVAVNRLKHGAATEARAAELVARLRSGAVAPGEAVRLGDELPVAGSLPALPEHDLERRLGHRFVTALRDAPAKTWVGPIPSRYGLHAVYVHERTPPRLPALAEVRDRVRRRFLQGVADEGIALRLAQLRADFDVVVTEGPS